MKKLKTIIKWLLLIWGAFSALGVIVLIGLATYSKTIGNKDVINKAEQKDVRFVLNWCDLGDERIEEITQSYQSSRSFTGDHLDAYAIKISHVDISELTKDEFGRGWKRCDQANGVLKDAIDFARGWLHQDEISWFITEDELGSEDIFVYPWSINCHGTKPAAVKLIFVKPKDKMIFYMSCKV